MRWLLFPAGFVGGALAGFMAEIGIAALVERWSGTRIEVPILLVPLLPAAMGVTGALLLLDVVQRTCGLAPSPLALLNAIVTVFIVGAAMLASLVFVANPFDDTPPSRLGDAIFFLCMLGPLAAMLVAWGTLRRRVRAR